MTLSFTCFSLFPCFPFHWFSLCFSNTVAFPFISDFTCCWIWISLSLLVLFPPSFPFLDRVSCSPGWPPTPYVVEDDSIHHPQASTCHVLVDDRYVSLCRPRFLMHRVEPSKAGRNVPSWIIEVVSSNFQFS